MSAYTKYVQNANATPQSEPIPGRETEMTANNAGGYTFSITPMQQFLRFLILGSEGGTYYASEKALTAENATNVAKLFASEQGVEAVTLLHDVSINGRAPKMGPILFALALAVSSPRRDVKKEAVKVFYDIVTTNSHLLEFISYADGLRGWGRTFRDLVRNWYLKLPVNKLAYQVAKYKNRHNWTTRDALRMSKPNPKDDVARSSVFAWAVGKPADTDLVTILAASNLAMKEDTSINEVVDLIRTYGLTREMISNTFLNDRRVWNALLEKMPPTALLRNLGKMTQVGLLKPLNDESKAIVAKLSDPVYIQKSKLHPLSILLALTTYKAGKGVKGSLVWEPVAQIVSALEKAFYASFKNVETTNKNYYIALDVSGSMGWGFINNTHMTARDAGMAMAMVVAKTEPNYYIAGFQSKLVPINVTANDSLDDAIKKVSNLPFGSTDCAAPIIDATKRKMPIDVFIVITDNETWAGSIQPCQALTTYNKQMQRNAKLIVMGMTATNFSIADPTNPNMLDVVGFDASVPSLINQFVLE